MQINLKDRLNEYIGLWMPVWHALYCLLGSLHSGISGAQDRTFARFYSNLGHRFAQYEEELTPVPRLMSLANGIVVELGPATGNQLPRFDRDRVTRIYGLEPNYDLFHLLKSKVVAENNMQDIYYPVHAHLEDELSLQAHDILPGSIDTVVCMQVLCCVRDAADAAKRIHRLLKPGGQLLFWEHERSGDGVTRVAQTLWSIIWSPLIGGCHLSRNIEQAVMAAGPWQVREFYRHKESPYSLLPRVCGRLVKLEE